MPGLYKQPAAALGVLVLMAELAVVASSPVVEPEPIRCAACSQETLDACPAVAADCKQVLREPGCGCCMACALERGAACGMYTAHCGQGLRCMPRPGEALPLHALSRGQGVCTQEPGQEEAEEHGSLHYLLGLNLPSEQQDTAEGQESIKARANVIRNKLPQQGPCHMELDAALDVIASSQQMLGEKFTTFYLPNCNKRGFYKAKQCESSLVGPPTRCWCVSPWNGKRILGSSDLVGDAECHQEVTH